MITNYNKVVFDALPEYLDEGQVSESDANREGYIDDDSIKVWGEDSGQGSSDHSSRRRAVEEEYFDEGGYDARDFGYRPKVRTGQKQYRRGESTVSVRQRTKGGSKGHGKDSQIDAFTTRMSRVMGVKQRDVPDLFVNKTRKVVRTNPLKLLPGMLVEEQSEILERALRAGGIDMEALGWFEGAYVFDAQDTAEVQESRLVQEGSAFIQNPSSYLPVLALEATPGQDVLDMCSSPGGKASLIAAITDNQANLTVNEPKGRRAQRLHNVLDLLGVEATYSNSDGRHLPNLLGEKRFDSVLVDAECSTESGINFNSSNPLDGWSQQRVERLSRLQRQLLVAGFDLLRPGGVMVYSTCTVSPEENEGVINELMDRRPGAIVQPLTLEAEDNSHGLRSWEGQKYHKAISEGVLRVYPSDLMEAFFVARIRKPLYNSGEEQLPEPTISLDKLTEQGIYKWRRQQVA